MTSWSERDWWTLVFKGFQVRGDVVEAIAESISDVLTALRHEVPTATRWKGIKDPFERTERLVDHVDANRRSDVLIAALWRALHAQVGLRYLLQPVEPFADSARPLETPQPAAQPPSLDDTVVPNTPVEAPLAAASESVVDEAASLDRITSALNLASAERQAILSRDKGTTLLELLHIHRRYGSLAGKKRLHYGEYVHRIDLPSEKKVLSIAITAKIDPSSIEVKDSYPRRVANDLARLDNARTTETGGQVDIGWESSGPVAKLNFSRNITFETRFADGQTLDTSFSSNAFSVKVAEAKTGQQTGLPTNIVFGVILRLPFLGGAKMSIVYNVEVAYESRSLVGRTKTVKQSFSRIYTCGSDAI